MSVSDVFDKVVGKATIQEGEYTGVISRVSFRVRPGFDGEEIPGFSLTAVPLGSPTREVSDAELAELGTQFIDIDIRRPLADTKDALVLLEKIGFPGLNDGAVGIIGNGIRDRKYNDVQALVEKLWKSYEGEGLPVAFKVVENVKANNERYRWQVKSSSVTPRKR